LETSRRQLMEESQLTTRLRVEAQQQQEEAAVALQERARLEADLQSSSTRLLKASTRLLEADTLAAVSAADQLPGLDDVELRELEAAVRGEYARRQQLTLQREREAMERERNEMLAMRAEMEQEREAGIREREAEREAREEAMECEMCMEREKNTAFQCGAYAFSAHPIFSLHSIYRTHPSQDTEHVRSVRKRSGSAISAARESPPERGFTD
jgi:hypothetical protein